MKVLFVFIFIVVSFTFLLSCNNSKNKDTSQKETLSSDVEKLKADNSNNRPYDSHLKASQSKPLYRFTLNGVKKISLFPPYHYIVLTTNGKVLIISPKQLFEFKSSEEDIKNTEIKNSHKRNFDKLAFFGTDHPIMKGHFLALDNDGKLYTWYNDEHDNLNPKQDTPTKLYELLKDKTFIQITANRFFNLALSNDNKLYLFGEMDMPGLISTSNKSLMDSYKPKIVKFDTDIEISQIASDFKAAFALDKDGKLYSWGIDNDGVLGQGGKANEQRVEKPTLITSLTHTKIIQIATHYTSAFAIDEEGRLYSWGNNYVGQLGHGDEKNRNKPTLVRALSGKKIIKVFATSCCAFALDDKDNLYVWGEHEFFPHFFSTHFDGNRVLTPKKFDELSNKGIIDVIVPKNNSSIFLIDKEFKLHVINPFT